MHDEFCTREFGQDSNRIFFNFIVFNSKTFQKWLDIHDNVQYETVVLMQADANAFFKIIWPWERSEGHGHTPKWQYEAQVTLTDGYNVCHI